ncbi:MAG: outer membrane protein assembly factor BamE [Pseudomonadota bacterium]
MNKPFHSNQTPHASNAIERPTLLPRLAAVLVVLMGLAVSGCAYRITIRQGNFLEEDTINQVEVGMTGQQVQFLLGTPMIEDPFHSDRWDYLYYVIVGRKRNVRQGHFIVHFDRERVASVERFTENGD